MIVYFIIFLTLTCWFIYSTDHWVSNRLEFNKQPNSFANLYWCYICPHLRSTSYAWSNKNLMFQYQNDIIYFLGREGRDFLCQNWVSRIIDIFKIYLFRIMFIYQFCIARIFITGNRKNVLKNWLSDQWYRTNVKITWYKINWT